MLSKGAGHYGLPRTVMTAVPAAKTRVAHSAAPGSFEGRAVHTHGVVHPAVSAPSVISRYAIGQAHAKTPPSTAADSRPTPAIPATFRDIARTPPVRPPAVAPADRATTAVAQEQRSLPARDPPQPAGRDSVRPVAPCPTPHCEENLLQNVLNIGSWQHQPQPCRQPGRVPGEQLAQSDVVAGRYPSDEVVVHRFSIALMRPEVHGAGENVGSAPDARQIAGR